MSIGIPNYHVSQFSGHSPAFFFSFTATFQGFYDPPSRCVCFYVRLHVKFQLYTSHGRSQSVIQWVWLEWTLYIGCIIFFFFERLLLMDSNGQCQQNLSMHWPYWWTAPLIIPWGIKITVIFRCGSTKNNRAPHLSTVEHQFKFLSNRWRICGVIIRKC